MISWRSCSIITFAHCNATPFGILGVYFTTLTAHVVLIVTVHHRLVKSFQFLGCLKCLSKNFFKNPEIPGTPHHTRSATSHRVAMLESSHVITCVDILPKKTMYVLVAATDSVLSSLEVLQWCIADFLNMRSASHWKNLT